MIHLFFRKCEDGQPVWGERRRYICETREEADAVIEERESNGWMLEDEQGCCRVSLLNRPRRLYTRPAACQCEEDTLCACRE